MEQKQKKFEEDLAKYQKAQSGCLKFPPLIIFSNKIDQI